MTDLTDERLRDNHLIGFLPKGEAAYVRQDNGMWGVAIFAEGTVDRLFTVAADMDKGVAAWVALRINGALASPVSRTSGVRVDDLVERIGEIAYGRHERGFVMWPLVDGKRQKDELRAALIAALEPSP